MEETPKHHVLVADDDPGVIDLLQEILEYEGYEVSTALNGLQALQVARRHTVDIAFLDLKMPRMDGLEALKAIKEIDPTVEAVIMTAYPSAETLREILENGASDYLIKPIERTEILRSLRLASIRRDLVLENFRMKRDLGERLTALEEAYQAQVNQFRSSQIKYRTIVDSSNDAMVVFQDDVIRFANKRALELLGYGKEEILRISFYQCIHPEDREEVVETLGRLLQGKPSPPLPPFRMSRSDGSSFWAEADPITIAWEDSPALLVAVRDVSQWLEAQRALEEAKERYEALFNRSMFGVYVHDLEGRFLDANDAALEILGYTREEISSLTLSSLLDERQLQLARNALVGLLEGRPKRGFMQYKVKTKDRRHLWVEVEGTLLYREGKPYAVQGIAKDITQRKEAEMALKESERKFRYIVENVKDGFVVFELDSGRFLYTNRHLNSLLGLQKGKIRRTKLWDLISQGDTESLKSSLQAFRFTKRAEITQLVSMRRMDGEPFKAELSIVPTPLLGKRAAQAIVRDVTEREFLKEQLVRTKKMEAVGTLAGGIAHEFNNILAAIQGFAQLSQFELGSDHPTAQYQQRIMEGCQRAADLVRKLLLYTRLDQWQKIPVDVGQFVNSSLEAIRHTLPAHVRVDGGGHGDSVYVLGEPTLLSQVITNLVSNAVDAMPNGGNIFIQARSRTFDGVVNKAPHWAVKGSYAEIVVRDTGTGMPPEVVEHVFDPFFTTKDPGKGVGLGLFLAHAIVENHGGHFEVESEPGKGSTFRIFLPALKAPMEGLRMEGQEKASSVQPKGRVLVIDDEEEFQLIAQEVLTKEGYEVVMAFNGKEALDFYGNGLSLGKPFDVVILDLRMPVMDGEECLSRLLEMDPNARVIVATGYGDEQLHVQGVKGRVLGVLYKPFDLKAMVGEVERALQTTRTNR